VNLQKVNSADSATNPLNDVVSPPDSSAGRFMKKPPMLMVNEHPLNVLNSGRGKKDSPTKSPGSSRSKASNQRKTSNTEMHKKFSEGLSPEQK